ncbi:DMT family transporter [Chitinibacter fontanus]|uniref:DMT family transporter n=1 Tax=Chitinibacter fontanus TaxID=1737446 RepID=A0A7D5Z3C6_9NEIS|nr:DMT family transporter [Chitinibacter fontanus]QLI80623.1 DMT family transporter [Chitinibacter fontanus]
MAYWYPLMAVLIWAANTVVSKAAAAVIDPAAISLYRWLIAALVLTPLLLPQLLRHWAQIRQDWAKFSVLALLGMVLYQSLAYFAAHSTSATNMGVICALIPLLGLLLNTILFRFRPTLAAIIGALLSFSGVVYLLGQGNPLAVLAAGINLGDGLMLLGASAYALYGILLRRWALPYGHWLNLYVQILLGVVLLLPVAATAKTLVVVPQAWVLLLFAGIASSILASFCWMQGVQRLGSERAAIFMNLLPLFTALIAVLVLNEQLQHFHYLGGGAILAGVLLVQLAQWRPASRPG